MAFDDEEIQRDIDLEQRLGILVLEAIEGKINLDQLYKKAEEFKQEIIGLEWWGYPLSNLLIRDALDEIHMLHDKFAGVPLEGHKDCLLGKKVCSFFKTVGSKKYEIMYLPYLEAEYTNGRNVRINELSR